MVPLRGRHSSAEALVSEFARHYSNPNTRHQYVAELTDLFASTGATHPRELTEASALEWCGGAGRRLANNTIGVASPEPASSSGGA